MIDADKNVGYGGAEGAIQYLGQIVSNPPAYMSEEEVSILKRQLQLLKSVTDEETKAKLVEGFLEAS